MSRIGLRHGDLLAGLPDGWCVRVTEDEAEIRRNTRLPRKRLYMIDDRPAELRRIHECRFAPSIAAIHNEIDLSVRDHERKVAEHAAMHASAVAKLAMLRALVEGIGQGSSLTAVSSAADDVQREIEAADAHLKTLRTRAKLLRELPDFIARGVVIGEIDKGGWTNSATFRVDELEPKGGA